MHVQAKTKENYQYGIRNEMVVKVNCKGLTFLIYFLFHFDFIF